MDTLINLIVDMLKTGASFDSVCKICQIKYDWPGKSKVIELLSEIDLTQELLE